MGIMLRECDHLPEGFLETPARRIHRIVPEPTLFHLPGRREPPLFVCVLLHGNEPVGLEAVQALLREMPTPLPRALSLFVGNVQAAAQGVRVLEGQPDFNRIWPGGEHTDGPEARRMQAVVDRMAERGVFASVDLHNNTGLNPHYGCVNRLDPPYLHLAALFARTVVHFTSPRGVQSLAMAPLCPAVTLECGRPGDPHGVAHARDYLQACMHLCTLPDTPVPQHDLDLFHTAARVQVPPEVGIAFAPGEADLVFDTDLDHMNFRELPAGTALARVRPGSGARVTARDETGREVTGRYFAVDGDRLVLTRPAMPSMLTLDASIVRQDCLCYLMERMAPPGAPPAIMDAG
ncbi:Succinylglutamate desuccinylase / Aspartoacylase family protein [Ectothiorhodospira mobilis]|uniref:Succinylglutamate desuccinylase / Aspartoacylase family protein n=2 Tax=Ectothiorhodospira mobilis TaxID=195064 RepID=A0A1I4PZ32_ECTMO|nr:Succinylglutamate desuccinylase / Aspartoacylase family protein [Ectothiorhodospira mobilis]